MRSMLALAGMVFSPVVCRLVKHKPYAIDADVCVCLRCYNVLP